jgi:hypothetical protein
MTHIGTAGQTNHYLANTPSLQDGLYDERKKASAGMTLADPVKYFLAKPAYM